MSHEVEPPETNVHELTAKEQAGRTPWTATVGMTTAVLAALASLSSLLSGHHTDAAMIDQIRAADQWNYYQSKGIKLAVLESKLELLPALNQPAAEADRERVERYKHEQTDIQKDAKEQQASADDHRRRHGIEARAVALSQVAIALCAIALLTHRRVFWVGSLILAAGGAFFLVQGAFPLS